MKKKVSGVVLAAVLAAGLTACGGFSAEDAANYVESALDAEYKGEFDEYVKQTDSTREEAEAMYQQGVDTVIAGMGLEELGISGDLADEYRDLAADLLAVAKYEVKSAEKDGDGYVVEVAYEPYIGMQSMDEELNAVMEEIIGSITGNETQEEIYEMVYDKSLDILQQMIDEPEYGEEATYLIHVTKDSGNTYSISQDDLVALDYAMFQSE